MLILTIIIKRYFPVSSALAHQCLFISSKCFKSHFVIFTFLFAYNFAHGQTSDFVTRWDLSKFGGYNTINFFTTNAAGSISYTWQEISPGSSSGSGSFAAGTATTRIISGLPVNAIIELRIATTNLQRFYMDFLAGRDLLVDVTQWGTTAWTSTYSMFYGCYNLSISATDMPNLSRVNDMSMMFAACTNLNGPSNIGSWNTSNVDTMYYLFGEANSFNQPIGNWNTAKVKDMSLMFYEASVFNQNISNWNTANVTNMAGMFFRAFQFNQPIGSWNTANVTNMNYMFFSAAHFNKSIGNWNTANVTNMANMFQSAGAFNQNIENWNTGNVTDMNAMFNNANTFNQPLNRWNTANVTDMSYMFDLAWGFDQPLGNWNTNNVTDMTSMLNDCGLSCDYYSSTLAGWAMTTTATGVTLGANGRYYGPNAIQFRNELIAKGWTIVNDNSSSSYCAPIVYFSKPTGDLNDLATWGTNVNGTGTQPTNFTNYDQYFSIRNRSTASISANWTVSGSNSMVFLGTSNLICTFSTGTNLFNGIIRLTNQTTFEIGSNSICTIICDNGSTVNYNGSSAQTVNGNHYYNLIISGSNNKTLNNRTYVAGTLTLGNKLLLDVYNLTLSGSISGNSATNYIQTNGSGTLNISVNSAGSFVFPVGNSNYNPVTISNNTGSSDHFSVRVQDAVYTNGVSGNVTGTPRVNRTWQIGKTNPTANLSNGVDFVFQWNTADETGSISTYQLNHHNGTAWNLASGTGTSSVAGSNPKTLTFTQYKGSFSPFSIGDGIIMLPVTWLYMHCNTTKQVENTIRWGIASEQNSKQFVVERSTDGKSFIPVGTVAAAGFSSQPRHYTFTDKTPAPQNAYYRIQQVDEDGANHLSEVCFVQTSSPNSKPIQIYPNPAESVIYIVRNETNSEPDFSYALYNAGGQVVAKGSSHEVKTGIPLKAMSAGVYWLQIAGNGFVQNEKVMVR